MATMCRGNQFSGWPPKPPPPTAVNPPSATSLARHANQLPRGADCGGGPLGAGDHHRAFPILLPRNRGFYLVFFF